jgi:hypothetical protein
MSDRLSTRFEKLNPSGNVSLSQEYRKFRLTVYEQEEICQKLQPHYQISTLAKLYDVHKDTLDKTIRYLLRTDDTFRLRELKGTTIVLVPASEVPKILKTVDYLKNRKYLR